MKKLIITHGDKGGVGKSIVAALTIDYALDKGPVLIVEGDRAINDMAERFKGVKGVRGISADLSGVGDPEIAMQSLFEIIEQAGAGEFSAIVINSPAGASATIDTYGEMLTDIAGELGYEVTCAFLMTPEQKSGDLAARSELLRLAHRRIVLLNDHYGARETFAWLRHPAREEFLQSGGQELELRGMSVDLERVYQATPGRPSTLALCTPGNGGLHTIGHRYRLKKWIEANNPALAAIYGVDAAAATVDGEGEGAEGVE